MGGLRPERNVQQGGGTSRVAGQLGVHSTDKSDDGTRDVPEEVGVLHSAGAASGNTIADGQAGSERGSDPTGQLRPNPEADISLNETA